MEINCLPVPAAPTLIRPCRSRTSGALADLLAAAGSLLIGASAALPWMAPPPGGEGDGVHAFHGPGFVVLMIALGAGLWSVAQLRAGRRGSRGAVSTVGPGREGTTASAPRPDLGHAAALLGAAVAEVGAVVWFAHSYRVDGDAVRVVVSGWYLALAGAALTMAAGVVSLLPLHSAHAPRLDVRGRLVRR